MRMTTRYTTVQGCPSTCPAAQHWSLWPFGEHTVQTEACDRVHSPLSCRTSAHYGCDPTSAAAWNKSWPCPRMPRPKRRQFGSDLCQCNPRTISRHVAPRACASHSPGCFVQRQAACPAHRLQGDRRAASQRGTFATDITVTHLWMCDGCGAQCRRPGAARLDGRSPSHPIITESAKIVDTSRRVILPSEISSTFSRHFVNQCRHQSTCST